MDGDNIYVFRRPDDWVGFLNALHLEDLSAIKRRGLKLSARLQHFERRNGLEHRFSDYSPKHMTVCIDHCGREEDYGNPFDRPQYVRVTALGDPELVSRCWNDFFPAMLAQGYLLQGPECGVSIATAPNVQFGTTFIEIGAELLKILPEFDSDAGKVGSMDNVHVSLTAGIEVLTQGVMGAAPAKYPLQGLKAPQLEEAHP